MTKKDESNTLNEEAVEQAGEWSWEEAVDQSFMEAGGQAELEVKERVLKWSRDVIKKFHQERSNKYDQ